MATDGRSIATDLALRWKGHLENLDDPAADGEDLAEYIDILAVLPTDDVEPAEIHSSFTVIAALNNLLERGNFYGDDHQIVLDALTAAMKQLGARVGIDMPDVRPH